MRKESGTLPVRINKHHIQNTIAAIRFHFYIYIFPPNIPVTGLPLRSILREKQYLYFSRLHL